MSGKVTRDSLALVISRKMEITFYSARRFVDIVLARMGDGIVQDEKLMLSNFGTFQVHSKGERIGRNPKTGADAMIAARKSVVFKPSKGLTLKDAP